MKKSIYKALTFALAILPATPIYAATSDEAQARQALESIRNDEESGYYSINGLSDAANYLARYSSYTDEDGNTRTRSIAPVFKDASTAAKLYIAEKYPEYAAKFASKEDWTQMYSAATSKGFDADGLNKKYDAVSDATATSMTRNQIVDTVVTNAASKACSASSLQSASSCIMALNLYGGEVSFFSAASNDVSALIYIRENYPNFARAYMTSAENQAMNNALASGSYSLTEIQNTYSKSWSSSGSGIVVEGDKQTQRQSTTLGTDETGVINPSAGDASPATEGEILTSTVSEKIKSGECKKDSLSDVLACAAKYSDDKGLELASKTSDAEMLKYVASKYPEFITKFASPSEANTLLTAATSLDMKHAQDRIYDYENKGTFTYVDAAGTQRTYQAAKENNETSVKAEAKQATGTNAPTQKTESNTGGISTTTAAGAATATVAGVAAAAAAMKKEEDDVIEDSASPTTSNTNSYLSDVTSTADAEAALEKYMNSLQSAAPQQNEANSAASSINEDMENFINATTDEEELKKELEEAEKALKETGDASIKKKVEALQKRLQEIIQQNNSQPSDKQAELRRFVKNYLDG